MKLNDTIGLYAGGDSWLVHPPGLITDTPKVRDIARRRMVKTNPDIDAGGPGSGRHKGSGKSERDTVDSKALDKIKKISQMTQKQYIKSQYGRQYTDSMGRPEEWTGKEHEVRTAKYYHEAIVNHWAPKYGIKVSPNVLKDYKKISAAKYKEDSQSDNKGFIGKKYRTQDTKYGHLIGEYDSSEEAFAASLARPYTRVLKHVEPQYTNKSRNAARKKAVRENPDDI